MNNEQRAAIEAVLLAYEKGDDLAMAAMMRACEAQFRAAFSDIGQVPA